MGKMDDFDKAHEIGQYNKKKIVDFHTNQEIKEFFIGQARYFDNNEKIQAMNVSPSESDFILYFSHYLNELLLIDNAIQISATDLVRVDFINKKVVLEKNFFKD
jgi:hypothetical protein